MHVSLGFPSEFKAGLQWQEGPPVVPPARAQRDLLIGWESLLQIGILSWYKNLS